MLNFTLGRDMDGREVTADLTTMPHILIAGMTGSGKSVAMNALLCDLIETHRPEELRLVLVDPKRVELAPYAGLPHLLLPPVIEVDDAIAALNWLANDQMEHRFKLLAACGARKIEAFEAAGHHLARIVVVIDELANLMLSDNAVEVPIVRIASMARAVGIHLVLGTQRPSADVLTGLIRANVPARIALATVTAMESKIILDEIGAEQLTGHGDMLVRLPGSRNLLHLQGTYVDDTRIQHITQERVAA